MHKLGTIHKQIINTMHSHQKKALWETCSSSVLFQQKNFIMIQYFPSKCHWSIFKFIIENDRSWKLFQRPASQEVIVCFRWAESSWGREVIKTKQLCGIDHSIYIISYTFILYNKHQHVTTSNPLTGGHIDDLFTMQSSSGTWVYSCGCHLHGAAPIPPSQEPPQNQGGFWSPHRCDCTGFSTC